MAESHLAIAGRVVAGIVGVAAGVVWVSCAIGVLRSRFAGDPAVDPHGFALIFGAVLALPAGLVCAYALSWVVPRRVRERTFRIAERSLVAASVGLIILWLTA